MYTTALIWLLLTPLILSLVSFAMRWLGHAGARLVEILHLVSVTAVLFLTIMARHSRRIKNLVATLSLIYLFAAILPWIYILYYGK